MKNEVICVSKKVPVEGMYLKCKKLTYVGDECYTEDFDAGWITSVEKIAGALYSVKTADNDICMFVI